MEKQNTYQKNKKYFSNYMREYMRKHPNYMREYGRKLKLKVLIHYGGNPPKCICCGEAEPRFLTIDHVGGDGQKERLRISGVRTFCGGAFYSWLRKNKFPNLPLQVMCSNCNTAKGKSKNKFCPVHHPELYSHCNV